jgi:hypothetical protein
VDERIFQCRAKYADGRFKEVRHQQEVGREILQGPQEGQYSEGSDLIRNGLADTARAMEGIMRLFFAATLAGLTMFATLSSASAWQCMARSTNGAVGLGSGIILERAKGFALRRCIAAGGNIPGYACSIAYCR